MGQSNEPSEPSDIAVVTGSSSGIGRAVADALVREGLRVAGFDSNPPVGVKGQEGSDAIMHVSVDVADSESIIAGLSMVVARLGVPTVLVNAAGIGANIGLLDTSASEFERTISVNLLGTFLMCKETVRLMVGAGVAGRIVNISSVQSILGQSGSAAYAASKGGVDALSVSLAVELAPQGIAVNVVRPGPVLTEMTRDAFRGETLKRVESRIPGGSIGDPSDIAEAVVFLSSRRSRFTTGTSLTVDGGYTVNGEVDR